MAQLISNLPIGAKVKFGKYSVNGETAQSLIWIIVAKNHSCTPAYPTNCVTLLTEKIVDLRPLDAKEPNNTVESIRVSGNNKYSVSNIDQWLNKDSPAGAWYEARHTYDQSPTSDYISSGTHYVSRPGFLNGFSDVEKNSLLSTNIRVQNPLVSAGYEDITRKVFLASVTEVGLNDKDDKLEGALWEYFATKPPYAVLTTQVWSATLSSSKPNSITDSWSWWSRSPADKYNYTRDISRVSERTVASPSIGYLGVRPATNISTSLKVSDTTDGDGCYTFIWNSAPPKPITITTPTIYGGKSNSISWAKVTDPDGDAVTYQLECSVNGGSYTQIYSGTALSYTHLVNFGTSYVTYRVKATDSYGESSGYTTSASLTVVNNYAPVISDADANLGVKSTGFTGTYSVTDANNNAVTVTESIDGVQIRSLVATLGATITYDITGNTWLTLPNGAHTLTIRATDGLDSTVRTYTFTKLVDKFRIENSTPWASSTMPTRIMLVVTRNIPTGAGFKVEVCNNGNDTEPTWEDATDAVTSGLVHVFTNTSKVSSTWGVKFRVTVRRYDAAGACYVSAIGGNFE